MTVLLLLPFGEEKLIDLPRGRSSILMMRHTSQVVGGSNSPLSYARALDEYRASGSHRVLVTPTGVASVPVWTLNGEPIPSSEARA